MGMEEVDRGVRSGFLWVCFEGGEWEIGERGVGKGRKGGGRKGGREEGREGGREEGRKGGKGGKRERKKERKKKQSGIVMKGKERGRETEGQTGEKG